MVGEAKEDVLPDCAGEHPGVLRGIGDTPTHGDVSLQGLQLPQQTLKQGGLHREEKWTQSECLHVGVLGDVMDTHTMRYPDFRDVLGQS